jgi:twitching motility protein PilT
MRDHDTIAAALTAAETGHLVLSTLHSGSADMAIHRIVDVYEEHEQEQVRVQLADVLRAVVTQRLLPSTRPPTRVPAIERLIVNAAVATKIRENRCHQIGTELQRGRAEGMVSFELSLATLVKQGLLARSTALEVADDPTLLEQLCR